LGDQSNSADEFFRTVEISQLALLHVISESGTGKEGNAAALGLE
jgi:hypothetical protein